VPRPDEELKPAAQSKDGETQTTATSTTAGGSAGQSKPDAGGAAYGSAKTMDAVSMLKEDHRKVEGLFAQFEKAQDQRQHEIIDEVCQELIIHSMLEEQIFYPATWQVAEDKVDEAQVEHDVAKVLILELMHGDDSDEFRQAKFKVLSEMIKQHIKEEEAGDGLFAKAQRAGVNTRELSQRVAGLKQQLMAKARDDRLPEPRPASFEFFGGARRQAPRSFGGRDRESPARYAIDDRSHRGRFREDDYESERRQGGYGRSYREDEEQRGYRTASHERGPAGEGRSFGDRERDYDEDDRDYRPGGRGGWSADPQGHSEAARRGWQNRR
jgi:hypothetical protein